MSGDAKLGSLQKPPSSAFQRLTDSLFPPKDLRKALGDTGNKTALLQRNLEQAQHSDYTLMTALTAEDDIEFDNGILNVSAEQYIAFRLMPAITELNHAAPNAEWQYHIYQTVMFFGTMVTGLLAVVGLRAWVPLVIAFLASVESIAQFEQVGPRLLGINGALTTLKNLKIWWLRLSRMEKRMAQNKMHLVEGTEDAIAASIAVYAQGMVRSRVATGGKGEEDDEGKRD
eukprot:gnl/TRDRNA2_/TRDRNA2_97516_c1_seq1.p1 gnl/TRDRNA2_/TRDRNA2_97516_c1~~gnl/TRDRNA2_/TRDRNA2_97516_c1_seq1.p1  ORF type:complete len:241 (-),score=48.54 gnl/TRDRNA2_/TRDRNA2_97516_c1_seq1:180-866(-)